MTSKRKTVKAGKHERIRKLLDNLLAEQSMIDEHQPHQATSQVLEERGNNEGRAKKRRGGIAYTTAARLRSEETARNETGHTV
jgi:hypothetical protein